MKDGSNNTFVQMKVNDLKIKVGIIQKKIRKKFNILHLTPTLISTNIPVTYLTHALRNIDGSFENYLVKFETQVKKYLTLNSFFTQGQVKF